MFTFKFRYDIIKIKRVIMAYDRKLWDRAKTLYESGLSTREISSQTGVCHTSIYKKSKQNNWCKNISKVTTNTSEEKKGYVYLISMGDDSLYYKIGIAIDVKNRLKGLQGGNPHKLYLKGSYFTKNMYNEEKFWHNRFLEKQVLNEWFKLDAEDVEIFMEYCVNDISDYVKYLEGKLIDNNISFERLKNWLD